MGRLLPKGGRRGVPGRVVYQEILLSLDLGDLCLKPLQLSEILGLGGTVVFEFRGLFELAYLFGFCMDFVVDASQLFQL